MLETGGKTPGGLFDCGPVGVRCSPFLSLDFIVVVASESIPSPVALFFSVVFVDFIVFR